MAIEKVGIIGTGTMGGGIMHVAALAGFQVLGNDVSEDACQKGVATIGRVMRIAVRMQEYTEEVAEAAKARIKTTLKLEDLADCDLIVEAVVEKMEVKKSIFGKLDAVCKPSTIFATNTSSLSVTEMAKATSRPDRFIGLHFFNPVPAMKLLEIVRTDLVSQATYEACVEFGKKCGKTIITAKDTPAFIVNFLLMPYLLGAARFYEQGVATKEDIDTGMKLGCGHPVGPLELLDRIGIDVALHVADTIAAANPGKREFEAPKIIRDLVAAGKLGRKTGEGFYKYGAKG